MTTETTIQEMAQAAKAAAKRLGRLTSEQKNAALLSIAGHLEKEAAFIKAENRKDLIRAEEKGLSAAMIDRLTVKDETIASMVPRPSAGLRP